MNTTELRQRGLDALVKELGYVGMVRFLQQFETGKGDYTKERQQWLSDVTLEDITQAIQLQHRGAANNAEDD
ncbi:MAG: hypothetical protein ACFCU9_14520 [Cyanophyceae cyanobacterium]|jgi:hypothetical protein